MQAQPLAVCREVRLSILAAERQLSEVAQVLLARPQHGRTWHRAATMPARLRARWPARLPAGLNVRLWLPVCLLRRRLCPRNIERDTEREKR